MLQYTVKAATQRLLQGFCRAMPGWVQGMGMRPRLWRDKVGALAPATALQQLEGAHKRSFDSMLAEGFGRGQQGRFSAAALAAGTRASWMAPSPPRLHPRQRVAAREAASSGVTSQRERQELQHVSEPAVDDTEDPFTRGLEPPLAEDAHWVAAYRRAADKRLPKALRVLGWQVLHAAVPVGDSRVYAARSRDDLLHCCCPQPHCQPQPSQQQPQQPQQPQPQPQPQP